MSTTEKTSEQLPDPLETIESFKQANEAMLRDVFIAHDNPSDASIETAANRMGECKRLANVFHQQLFFKDSGNPLIMNLALTTIIESSTEIGVKAQALNPNLEEVENFKEGIQPWVEYCISEDASIEISEEIQEFLQRAGATTTPTPEEASKMTCHIYLGTLDKLEGALLGSENIVNYVWEKNNQKYRHEARKKQAINFGGMAIAAFAGTYLANKLQKRN